MLRIGIIGAGSITSRHIASYMANPHCEVVSIADINIEQAQKTAGEFGIKNIYTDYHDILNDESIDAVSIATPTFTHKEIALDAIKNNKHILCEKPPALNADEVKEIQSALKDFKKTFMFAFVRRFCSYISYTKDYIDSGKMGKIICAEGVRVSLMANQKGWFANRRLGGGALRDAAIHELDSLLYLMGYPKPKTVTAFESRINNDLPSKIKSTASGYASANTLVHKNDTEDIIKGFITLDNGANIYIKAGSVLLSHKTGCYCEINGEKAGALLTPWGTDKHLQLMEVTNDLYLNESVPKLPDNNAFADEINHFIDCCLGKTECIIKTEEAVTVMEIIDAIYKSAETGNPVIFNN